MRYLAIQNASLLETLATMSPQSSKTTLRSWVKEGRVSVDGEIAKRADQEVQKGQKVEVGPRPNLVTKGVEIVYEDPHLIVINKPIGMLSVATAFEKGETAHAILKAKYRPKKVYVVHRLDQDTSGIMLFALSEKAWEKLKNTFEKHAIDRKYCALVEGTVQSRSGSWRSYLWEDPNYVVRSTPDPDKGRLAITHYRRKGISKKYTWLELTLETGRKNQIRVQCADAGHPVLGDAKYGATANPMKRLGLHAQYLAFDHPITGKKMTFNSKIPAAFQKIIDRLEEEDA
mgnify:CR=1 FL=1